MTFYLDENLPPAVGTCLAALGEPAVAVSRSALHQMKDPALMAAIGAEGGCLISRDGHQLHEEAVVAALVAAKVGVFYLAQGSDSAIELARTIFRAWPNILSQSNAPRPFVMRVSVNGQVKRAPFDAHRR